MSREIAPFIMAAGAAGTMLDKFRLIKYNYYTICTYLTKLRIYGKSAVPDVSDSPGQSVT